MGHISKQLRMSQWIYFIWLVSCGTMNWHWTWGKREKYTLRNALEQRSRTALEWKPRWAERWAGSRAWGNAPSPVNGEAAKDDSLKEVASRTAAAGGVTLVADCRGKRFQGSFPPHSLWYELSGSETQKPAVHFLMTHTLNGMFIQKSVNSQSLSSTLFLMTHTSAVSPSKKELGRVTRGKRGGVRRTKRGDLEFIKIT